MKRISILIFSLLLAACGGDNKSKTPVVDSTPDTPAVSGSQEISINLSDLSGGPLLAKATLSFAGVEVFNSQGQAITTAEVTSDSPAITIKTTTLVEAEDLRILAKATGYVDMGATVQLESATTEYRSNILLVPEQTGKVKEGIYTQVTNNLTNIGSDGVTSAALNLTLNESATTPKLAVSIPEGTKLLDEDGNAVIASSAVMVRFDPSEENVLDAYPGGLNVQADVLGVMEQVDFKSAGFASIVLKDDAGKKVKNFDQDITVAMQFKIGTTDGSGRVVEVDDIVPVWSYNEDKGTWTYEKDGRVQDLNTADNLYDVVYTTNHLTYFNLDWKTDVCDAQITVEDNANVLQNNLLKVVLKLKDYNVEKSFTYKGDGFINLSRIPDSRDWELQFLDPITNEVIDTKTSTSSICGDSTVAVDLPSIGNLPVTKTEVAVGLYCGTNEVKTADVYVYDKQGFFYNYGLAINEPFNFRTGSDGVLNVYDLPQTLYDRILEVDLYATDVDTDLVSLAMSNTSGPFTIKIGRDKEVNAIQLALPESYCNEGGFTESKISATLSCPSGLIPNTELQTMPFRGYVTAQVANSDDTTTNVSKTFVNGEALLQLIQNTDYELTLNHSDSVIAQNITNNDSNVVITAGNDQAFDFLLTGEYCAGDELEVEGETYTYTTDQGNVVETVHINSVGSIDLKDYVFPPQSGILNYRTFSTSAFSLGQPEQVGSESATVTVDGNNILLNDEDGDRTDFTIESDRIAITNYETEEGTEQIIRNGAVGRLYNVGDTMYEMQTSGENVYTYGDITSTVVVDINYGCSVVEKLNSFSQKGFSYSGEIIRVKCDMEGSISSSTVGGSNGTETSAVPINATQYTYFEKGVGEIASIDEDCIPAGSAFADNTPGCTVNQYDYRFLIE